VHNWKYVRPYGWKELLDVQSPDDLQVIPSDAVNPDLMLGWPIAVTKSGPSSDPSSSDIYNG